MEQTGKLNELIAELRGHIREVPLTLLRDAADALEAADKRIEELEAQEPTEKQVVDYCRKRCLVIVDGELFQRMKATYALLPKEGEWEERYIEDANPMFRRRFYCSHCGEWTTHGKTRYCPNCGAKMTEEDHE